MRPSDNQLMKYAIKANLIFSSFKNPDLILKNYPKGSCHFASDILGIALKKNNIENIYIAYNGRRQTEDPLSHAWLEVDKTVVDITCYQFREWESIYVGKLTEWHLSFKDQKRRPINEEEILIHWAKHINNLASIIDQITSFINDN